MVLHHLQRAPGHKLRRIDLAERLGLTASGVTRTLLPLEKMGLVARQPDPRDARVGYAALTDAGARLYADALVAARMVAGEATQNVPDAQLAELADVLGRLAGIVPSTA
jgi:DNA-binding MarR family transcriptional regulator